ncbi:uncharacterized protein LOC115589431 [Sparus aurata]|uniref:Uncharacterized LOC115589431 n=1 Tax=Sparus aurata TaxID=8175 RepID=A0A671Y0V3_SPAAU|nr:uncharacterized protein LOC115589431 [Sparus aurata]
MSNFNVMKALLLCSLGWISVSGSDSQTVEVQTGDDVSLLCSNYTSSPTQIIWFSVVKRSQPHCVSHMFKATEPATLCDGFKSGKFETSSNISTLFLRIKQVDSSDSGLYFCGYSLNGAPVIVSGTYLEVQEVIGGTTRLTGAILGSLTVVLVIVAICLAVKIKKLQKACAKEQNPRQTESSDDLNYAAVTFRPMSKRNHRPASDVTAVQTQEENEASSLT